jgi:hypothetical protein
MHRLTAALLAVATTGLRVAAADDAVPPSPPGESAEVTQLRDRVARLESTINQMMEKDQQSWLSDERAAQIRELVADTLADADSRASLQSSGATAGWDKGFFLQSADGNFRLNIGGQIQFRYVYNYQNDSPTDDNRYGFEVRRSKLVFKGHIFDPSWQYELELDSNRNTGSVQLGENVWVQKDFGGGFVIRAGQFKPFYLREENVSSRRLLAVERSNVNTAFTAGIAQGVQAMYTTPNWRIAASYIDGFNTGNNTPYSAEDQEFAFTGRTEFLAWGDWKAIEDDNAFRDGTPALMFGLAGSFQRGEFGTGNNTPPPNFNNNEMDQAGGSADVTWKLQGFSLSGILIYQNQSSTDGARVPFNFDQWGAVLRGGLFVTDDVELYAVYEWGDYDQPNQSNLSTLTAGFNWFFHKNDIKWSTDIGYGFNPVAAPWVGSGGSGWRVDAPGEDGQIVFRSQIQLLF